MNSQAVTTRTPPQHPDFPLEWRILCLCATAQVTATDQQSLVNHLREVTNWDALVNLAESHCVTQPLARNLLAYGATVLPREIAQQLQEQTHQYAIKAQYFQLALVRLLRALAAHGAQAVPLKGPVLALKLYGDAVLRDSVDLDIAIKPEQLAQAQAGLASLGYELCSQLPALPLSELIKQENALVYRSPQGTVNVDLHWRFTKPLEGFDLSGWTFWDRVVPFSLAGQSIEILADEDILILLILHAAKDQCDRLKHFADVAAFIRAFPNYDWQAALIRARALNIDQQLLLLLRMADQLWSLPIPEWLRERCRNEPTLALLERIAYQNLFQHNDPFALSVSRTRFVLATRRNRWQQVKYLARYLFQPNPFDWAWVQLPASLSFLYPLVHVQRLLWNGGRRLFRL